MGEVPRAGESPEERQRLRLVLEGAGLGSWEWNVQTGATVFDETWAALVGYTLDELAPSDYWTWERLVHPEDLPAAREALGRCLAGDTEAYESEFRMRHKAGHWVWILDRGRVMRWDAEGKPLSMFGTHADITRLKAAEGALRESERYRREILETAADGFLVVDALGRVVEANRAYCAMSGYGADEVVGMIVADLYADAPHDETAARLARVVQSGSGIFEARHRRKDGTVFPVEVSISFLAEGVGQFICFFRDLSERQASLERLILLDRTLEAAPASITIHDTEGRFFFANRATLAMHGFESVDELLGLTLRDIDVPESTALVAERMRLIAERGEGRFEVVHRRKDGSTFPLEVIVKQIEWEGRPAMLSIASDITDRKRAEAVLERRLLALTQPLGDVGSIDVEELVNIAELQKIQDDFAAAFGVASIITRPDGSPLTKPSNFTRLCRDLIRSTEKGLARCYEADAALGRHHPAGPTVIPCLSCGLLAAGTSISVGGHHVASWLVGQVRDGTTTDEDVRAFAREIGADEQEAVAAFREVPAMGREDLDRMARLLHTLASRLSDMAYQNVQQARFISERRRAEAERERLQEELAQAQKMESVGRLAGGVAHDFNNMLNVILGHVELILDELRADDPMRADLLEVQQAAERSANLTRQLLAFARRQTVSPRVLDLNATVASMASMLRRLIGEDVELLFAPGEGLGPVRIDPAQVDQVLANLCVNARDAIGHGVGRVTIETSMALVDEGRSDAHPGVEPGEHVVLSVTDDGSGMDAETRERIFEPFFTTKAVGVGTGLGLATVYGIVRQNGGFIEVESEPGVGTTFRIYLPAERPEVAEGRRRRTTSAPGKGSETVLLVEDEPSILTLGRKMLERQGYTVLCASTPGEAIRVAREHPGEIHLVVTDVVMPEMNGRELAKSLLSLHPRVKRLFMSGYTADVIAHQGVLDEGVMFIQKPFTQKTLTAKVREALDS